MLRLVVAIALLAAVMAAPSAPLDHDEQWGVFKNDFQKKYDTMEEELKRHEIFLMNLEYIEQHNAEADAGVHTYWLDVNQFADMNTDEITKTMNGLKMPSLPTNDVNDDYFDIDDLPTEVDWRKQGYVTPVKNQGSCGSCWAFSTTGSLEGQHFKKDGKLVSLSEQNLVDCSGKQGNQGCEGGLMDQAFTYIKVNHGIDTEASYPYTAMDGTCKYKSQDVGATDTGFVDVVPHQNEASLQSAVANVGPISVAIDASHTSFHFYKKGVYYEPACSSTRLDHGVLAVGYGAASAQEDGQDFWIVKNSWGAKWGTKGYIMMSRNKDNNCGIATLASYPSV